MNDYVAHEEEKEGYRLEIVSDSDPMNPRTEWDNVGTMVCFHRDYTLGDKHNFDSPQDAMFSLLKKFGTREEKRAYIIENCKGVGSQKELRYLIERNGNDLFGMIDDIQNGYVECTVIPDFPKAIVYENLYLYDHSGITMSTGKFSCPWDSGQVGFIYVEREAAQKELSSNPAEVTDEQIEKCLKSEVDTYDDYLTGNVWGFRITRTSDGEEEESCWGFFGQECCLDEARSTLNYLTNNSLVENLG